ncbi:MAG TPA: hypothetical protein VM120_14575 [Bryobacteraceae bacterium]|nr:hypothetical protein [Bryobacteraceae bacterium]
MPRANLEIGANGRSSRYVWGRKEEEYVADFHLVTKRTLDEHDWQLFRFHFLLGADWKLCARRLSIDRGTFFHSVYRIEQKLGRTYRELEPYGLYPLDQYFGGTVRREAMVGSWRYQDAPGSDIPEASSRVVPIRPPVNRRQAEAEEKLRAKMASRVDSPYDEDEDYFDFFEDEAA